MKRLPGGAVARQRASYGEAWRGIGQPSLGWWGDGNFSTPDLVDELHRSPDGKFSDCRAFPQTATMAQKFTLRRKKASSLLFPDWASAGFKLSATPAFAWVRRAQRLELRDRSRRDVHGRGRSLATDKCASQKNCCPKIRGNTPMPPSRHQRILESEGGTSARCGWVRRSRPMLCSSARAARSRWRSRAGSATLCASDIKRGRRSSRGTSCFLSSRTRRLSRLSNVSARTARSLRRSTKSRHASICRSVRESGIDALAIVLMHGWKFTDHEKRVAEIARDLGFTQVSVSHEVAPLIKLVGRGDTTVVDAYLSPILRRYVERVAARTTRRHEAAVHAVQRRADRCRMRSGARMRSCPARPAASSAWSASCRRGAADRLRHGRHVDRRVALCGPLSNSLTKAPWLASASARR